MNIYGLRARDYWRAHAPTRYAELENPEQFFQELGETALSQVDRLARQLEQQIPSGLDYLEQVAQLRAAQKQAEEIVLAELIYSVEPEPASPAEELDEILGQLPSPAMIRSELRRLLLEAEMEAEREGWSSPVLTDEQQAQRERLEALLPLVTVPGDLEEMSVEDLQSRIEALRPFMTELAT